jgi:N-acetylneuraminic acid mutarotase
MRMTLAWLVLGILFSRSAQAAQAQSQKMAYLKQIGKDRVVMVKDLDSKKEILVSDANLDSYHPEMSPLGTEVAFSTGLIEPGQKVEVQLVVKNLLTNDLELWTDKANQYIHAEYSGNGNYLVFSGPNPKTGKQNIGIIDLIKERAKGPINQTKQGSFSVKKYQPTISYIDSQFDCYAPAVSSTGKKIVFHRTLDPTTKTSPKELMIYDTETKQRKMLTAPQGHAMFPSLSADDRYVVYVSKSAGQWDIFMIDTWKGTERQITNDMNIEFTPIFAPDDSVYFTRFDQGTIGVPAEIGIFHLTRDQVFNKGTFPTPKTYLNKSGIAEYVPSFSGKMNLELSGLPSFPKPERSSFGAITYGDKVYIIGGHQGPEHTYPKESFLDRMDVYDMKTKTWTQKASMNIPKHGFEIIAYNGYIYVFGGFAFSATHNPGWKSLDSIERYNIATDKWEILKTRLPKPRSSNIAEEVNGVVYLIGGWDSTPQSNGDKNGRFHDTIDMFDLSSETVQTSKVKLAGTKRRAFNSAAKGNKIYMMGGISEGASHFDWIDNVTVLDTTTMTFTEETKLPYATFAPGAGFIGDKLYLIGGMVLRNKATYDLDYVDDLYEYDLAAKKWTHLGKYLSENKGFPQVVPMPQLKGLGILGGHTYIQDSTGRTIDHPVDSFDLLNQL